MFPALLSPDKITEHISEVRGQVFAQPAAHIPKRCLNLSFHIVEIEVSKLNMIKAPDYEQCGQNYEVWSRWPIHVENFNYFPLIVSMETTWSGGFF